ncbi:MAG TPA: glucosidase [Anaeromyxobacteraceae bacterium]|nr:glucosidase [Anaeromyxobacteraceae bacterium]
MNASSPYQDPERARLDAADRGLAPWRRFGPYLALRAWGTVREDYSPDDRAWKGFTFEEAECRAYRWSEDGIGGLCDDEQRLCLSLALWNGTDPILKERLFGLTGEEGNHGEDLKEIYHFLDALPSHAYARVLYRYPQAPFPYALLREEAARRGRSAPEFEIEDTGIFEGGRFFDVTVEHAKREPEEILFRVSAVNRGPQPAPLHLLPTLFFRNTWSWGYREPRPLLALARDGTLVARHPTLGAMLLQVAGPCEWLFCENETNLPRLYGVARDGYFKDGLAARLVRGDRSAVNPAREGTKAGAWFTFQVRPGDEVVVRARLARTWGRDPFHEFDEFVALRRREADAYHRALAARPDDPAASLIARQALAGLCHNRIFYHWDVAVWKRGDPGQPPPPPGHATRRNLGWDHLHSADVLTVPDGWEFPWFAAWDTAFQCVALARADPTFAKEQLLLFTREWFMHPNGQLPAYEWQLSDVNPPVHAWAALRVYEIDREVNGHADRPFLERVFLKLLLNFTWWVNREDEEGRNVFQGGFLGLDNIGVFNRSEKLPSGAVVEQADGTAWMAAYCLDLLKIALELSREEPIYEDVATKFFEHFLYIAGALNDLGGRGVGLWHEGDQFFYDAVRTPDGRVEPLRVRSLVGLIPLLAVAVVDPEVLTRSRDFARRMGWFLHNRSDLARQVSRFMEKGGGERRLFALLRAHRMKALLARMLDEEEFLSPFGVRSLSRAHGRSPYTFTLDGRTFRVAYEPGESSSDLFGGNSNWRGPVWMPLNVLLIEALRKFHHFYGPAFRVECPTHSGRKLSLGEVADELTRRVTRLFLPDPSGKRPCRRRPLYPGDEDLLLFHEYFHGEDGRGLGASHQTGWTALVAELVRGLEDRSQVSGRFEEARGPLPRRAV